jgi:hypothetical protein
MHPTANIRGKDMAEKQVNPICACGHEMKCVKNGVAVIRYQDEQPITVIHGEKFGCPGCGAEVVSDFSRPVHSGQDEFEGELSRAERNANTVRIQYEYQ